MAAKRPPAPPTVTAVPAIIDTKPLVAPFVDVSDWTLNNPDRKMRDFGYDILKRSHRGVEHSAVAYVRAKLRHPVGSLDLAGLHRDVTANRLLLPRGASDMLAQPDAVWREMDNHFMKLDQDLLAGPTIFFPGTVEQHWATRQVMEFAQVAIADTWGAAVHVIAHTPARIAHASDFHVHVLCSAREVTSAGLGAFIRPILQSGCQVSMKAAWDDWWSKS
jgi:hypothetical protein